jgi:hypothetical protein
MSFSTTNIIQPSEFESLFYCGNLAVREFYHWSFTAMPKKNHTANRHKNIIRKSKKEASLPI